MDFRTKTSKIMQKYGFIFINESASWRTNVSNVFDAIEVEDNRDKISIYIIWYGGYFNSDLMDFQTSLINTLKTKIKNIKDSIIIEEDFDGSNGTLKIIAEFQNLDEILKTVFDT